MQRINLFTYSFRCEDCNHVTEYVKVALNSLGEINFAWCCPHCQRDILIRLPVEKLIDDVPLEPASYNADDLKWLKACHITFQKE